MDDIWIRFREMLPEQGAVLMIVARVVVIIVLLAIVYGALVRGLSTLRTTGRLLLHSYTILRRIGKWAIFVCGALIILQQFGLMENAWATLTAMLAMVAVGFVAVWSVLSNTLCSIMLMVSQPFEVGDTIGLTGDKLRGRVVDFKPDLCDAPRR